MSMTRPPYPSGFREQMVELVRSSRSPEELAREFEPSAQSIRVWMSPVMQAFSSSSLEHVVRCRRVSALIIAACHALLTAAQYAPLMALCLL